MEENIQNITNRISSLFPYLIDFYVILQNYGIEEKESLILKTVKKKTELWYVYEKTLKMEKELENGVKELKESLENLKDFLCIQDDNDEFS